MGIYPYQEFCIGVLVNELEHQQLLNLFPSVPKTWYGWSGGGRIWYIPSSVTSDYLTVEQWRQCVKDGVIPADYVNRISGVFQIGDEFSLPANLTDTPVLQQMTAIANAVGKQPGWIVSFKCFSTL